MPQIVCISIIHLYLVELFFHNVGLLCTIFCDVLFLILSKRGPKAFKALFWAFEVRILALEVQTLLAILVRSPS